MGYRQYFSKVNRKKIEKIRDLDRDGLIKWCKENDVPLEEYNKEEYIDMFEIFDKLGAKQAFEFGEYYENADEIMKNGKVLFNNSELVEEFADFAPYMVTREAVRCAIEWQREKILKYFKSLLLEEHEYEKNGIYFDSRSKQQRLEDAVQSKIIEWEYVPYQLGDRTDKLTTSWLYEYTIFELIKIYKDTNWDEDCLIFYGY